MGFRSNKVVLMKAISELKDADYSREPELYGIYKRLQQGRKQFVEAFDKNIKAVMQISSLDLTMQYQNDKIVDISRRLSKAVEPVVDIEKTLDDTVKQMGTMTEDAFYHLKNEEFAKYVSNAITAHNTWLGNLQNMVRQRTVLPLQLNSTKCGFGHFYYAMTPQIPEILPIWNGLGEKHKRFHQYGAAVIQAIQNEQYSIAEQTCNEAQKYSLNLIADMEKMLQLIKG